MSNIIIRKTGAADYGRFIKMLICGSPGAGKTILSSTAPDPLYLSAEGGLMSVADRNIPYVDIRDIETLFKMKTLFERPADFVEEALGFPVKTVIIDTIDEIQRILIRERLTTTKQDAIKLQDWSYIADHMSNIVKGFRNLNMNVIFTCHLKEVNDTDTGRTSYKPQIQGGFADQIAGQVDLALLLKSTTKSEVVDSKIERVIYRILSTTPDPQYEWIKDRSGKLPKELEVNFKDDFERIHEYIYGGQTLKEGETKEIAIEIPKLDPLLTPSQAAATASRPRRPRPTVPTRSQVAAAKEESSVETPVEPPVAAEENPVKEAPKVVEIPKEEPVVEQPTYPTVNGLVVKNDIVGSDSGDMFLTFEKELENLDHGTDWYCQSCGKELETIVQGELSKVRFKKVYDTPCFDAHKRQRAESRK